MTLNISSGKETLKIKINAQFKKGEKKLEINWKGKKSRQQNKINKTGLFKKVEENASRLKDWNRSKTQTKETLDMENLGKWIETTKKTLINRTEKI